MMNANMTGFQNGWQDLDAASRASLTPELRREMAHHFGWLRCTESYDPPADYDAAERDAYDAGQQQGLREHEAHYGAA